MESRQGDKLKTVAHHGQFWLKLRDFPLIQLGLPMERRGAIVGEELSWMPRMNGSRKFPGLLEVGLRGFAPEHVGIRRVCQATCDRGIESPAETVEALDGP